MYLDRNNMHPYHIFFVCWLVAPPVANLDILLGLMVPSWGNRRDTCGCTQRTWSPPGGKNIDAFGRIWAHLGAFSETESRSDLSGNVVTAPIQSRNELTQFGATIAENRARFHSPPLRFSFTLSRYVCVCVCAGVWVCKCVGWANNQHNFTGNSTLIRNSGSVHLLFSYATNLIKMN